MEKLPLLSNAEIVQMPFSLNQEYFNLQFL